MRVLVCGGRNFDDAAFVHARMDELHAETPITVLIEGGAKGADFRAGKWARFHHIAHFQFPAEWAKYGKAAGSIRNARMLKEGAPDLVVAFPGGVGTADMVRRARREGIQVIEFTKAEAEHRSTDTRPPEALTL